MLFRSLIAGLSLAQDMGISNLQVQSDSQLVVNQLQGSYQTRDAKMAAYLELVKKLQSSFEKFSILQVPRTENNHADALANLGAAIQTTTPMPIPLVYIQWPATWKDESISQTVAEISVEPNWMTPIATYLTNGQLPEDRNEARRVRTKAARFTLHDGQLYKRSYSGPLLRCVNPNEVKYILTELHEGECGNHSGARSLANRALTTGYYWPTMRIDSKDFVQRCDPCQRHSKVSHVPPEKLHSTIAPWPFMKWGMDIVGKLPTAPGQRVFMLAVTDYFTKWVEAEAFKQVRDREVKNFIWKHVICRFGVPKEIVTDNGSQFISHDFQDFCMEWGIKLTFSTPRYPQANGQAEATNKTIVSSLKKRLTQAKGAWADELPAVLWSYRTTPRTPTGETPFSLTYGTEAVIPVEAGLPTARYKMVDEQMNNSELEHELDTIDELRERALIRNAAYQHKAAQHFNKHIRVRTFKEGNWVLHHVFQNTKEAGAGKLGPNWEGPYQVTKVVGNGAYKLETKEGRQIANSWNAIHLKRYYF